MKKLIALLALLTLPLSSYSQNYAQTAGLSPFWKYKTFETAHFKVTYQDGLESFAKKAAQHLEHAHTILSPILQWEPRYKTSVLCIDGTDAANGFAAPPLRIGMVLFATPPETWFSTSYSEDWIKLLTFHEYTHILNIDPSKGVWEFMRYVFGDVLRPNALWPSWMLEGLAVYYETRTSKLGRGRSPYYEGILRAMAADNVLGKRPGITMDQVNGEVPYFPGGEIPYIFGYHLWNKIDNDKVAGEYSIRSARRFPYLVNGNLNARMGKTWGGLWDEWLQESYVKYGKEIEALKQQGLSSVQQLSNADYSALGAAISPDGQWLAYNESTTEKRNSLVALNLTTQKKIHLLDKILGVGLSFSKDSNTLFFSEMDRHDFVVTTSDIFSYNFKHNSTKQLTFEKRAKDPTLSPDQSKIAFIYSKDSTNFLGIADVAWHDGEPELKNIKQLYSPMPFTLLANPKFSPDGKSVAFSAQIPGKPSGEIVSVDLEKNSLTTLVQNGQINKFPNFDSQGNLIYVSDLSGVDEVYTLKAGKTLQLTRTIGGTWMPFYDNQGSLYASTMTSKGFQVAKFSPLSNAATAKEAFTARAPKSIPESLTSPDLATGASESYSPWSSLAPRQWWPFFFIGTQNSNFLLGGEILGFDSTGQHQYDIGAGYQFQPKTLDYTVSYTNYTFGPFWNLQYSEFSDHVGSKYYTRNKEVSTTLVLPLAYTYHSWNLGLGGFFRDKDRKDIATGTKQSTGIYEYQRNWIPGIVESISFNNLENSKQGFVPEGGWLLKAASETLFDSGVYKPVFKVHLDAQTFIELFEHSSLNPRVSLVTSTHPTETTTSYTKLEGRDPAVASDLGKSVGISGIHMRGYSNSLFFTRTAAKVSADYYFPVAWLFRGGKTTPFFMQQITGVVFAEYTIVPVKTPVHFTSIGTGIGIDTLFFFRIPLRFGVEFHQGLNKTYGGASEVFFSMTSSGLF